MFSLWCKQTHFGADSYGLQSYRIQEGMPLESYIFSYTCGKGILQIKEALSSKFLLASGE